MKTRVALATMGLCLFFQNFAFGKDENITPATALREMQKSHFASSITKGTKLRTIFKKDNNYLFYYTNIDPESGHGSERLVVFLNDKYSHDYYLNQSCGFIIIKSNLICHFTDFPGLTERNRLSDVFAGKRLLIGGSEVRPWRGSKELYR